YCSGRNATPCTSLATTCPDLAREWHPTKNGDLTPADVKARSSKKVWWQCESGHEWHASITNRAKGRGCPYCSNKKVDTSNCLATSHPTLTEEWHPTRNGELTPMLVTAGSKKTVWWRCDTGHVWQASVSERTRGRGCPYCSNKRADTANCLA